MPSRRAGVKPGVDSPDARDRRARHPGSPLFLLLTVAAFAGDKVSPKQFLESGTWSVQGTPTEAPVTVTLKPERIPVECVDTDTPGCVAISVTFTNTSAGVVTVDLDRIVTTWWRGGAQHPIFPARHTWVSRADGFADVVLPPGASWSNPFTPSNRNVATDIAVEDALALNGIFQPGYTFSFSVPVTADGKESWYSATFVSAVGG